MEYNTTELTQEQKAALRLPFHELPSALRLPHFKDPSPAPEDPSLRPAATTRPVTEEEIASLRNDLRSLRNQNHATECEVVRQHRITSELTELNAAAYEYLEFLDYRLKRLWDEVVELREDYAALDSNNYESVECNIVNLRNPRRRIPRRRPSCFPRTPPQPPFCSSSVVNEDDPIDDTVMSSDPLFVVQEERNEEQNVKNTNVLDNKGAFVNKRKPHNLDKLLVPANTIIPRVPLTDLEIVVYFFNSLSRPLVACRLYARGWGPAKITDIINAHRQCSPPFLRNTCSVKCITAQRKGMRTYPNWDSYPSKFSIASDAEATELIRIKPEEMGATDVDVLDMMKGLKKHAEGNEDEGTYTGIFTECVKYLNARQMSYPLSEIHNLADMLQHGEILLASASKTHGLEHAHRDGSDLLASSSDPHGLENVLQNGSDSVVSSS
ncbi:hypothetical protein B0J11DRAFT_613773 [Dendryphion nanum]|uniref:Uncharacterized protein n=1 Tax=Dendryphion nanum TaxID=256645 RepID=A0A9P9IQA2_9PLEO|nr:hypothetical protein B0J11DRAFT_613773 [Dendryphion nanum]